VNELPARYRQVVTHRYLLGLSEAETAAALGIPAGTVKSRTARALTRLEQALAGVIERLELE
jgi:RNA polymerase sigma-70 factor (ECF subfamily)